MGVIYLDNQISIFGSKSFDFFSLTGFQLGPGLVYLFLKMPLWDTRLFHYIRVVEPYSQHVVHEIYTNNYVPYWFSAFQLHMEIFQLNRDCLIWDNKKFAYSGLYGDTLGDETLLNWRKWFSQYYDGCETAKKKKKELEW